MGQIIKINQKKINLSSFGVKEIEKGYTEGVYIDSPANRKLGRVGMSYKDWEAKKAGNDNNSGKPKEKESPKTSFNLDDSIFVGTNISQEDANKYASTFQNIDADMKKTLPDNVYNLLKGSISADIKNGKLDLDFNGEVRWPMLVEREEAWDNYDLDEDSAQELEDSLGLMDDLEQKYNGIELKSSSNKEENKEEENKGGQYKSPGVQNLQDYIDKNPYNKYRISYETDLVSNSGNKYEAITGGKYNESRMSKKEFNQNELNDFWKKNFGITLDEAKQKSTKFRGTNDFPSDTSVKDVLKTYGFDYKLPYQGRSQNATYIAENFLGRYLNKYLDENNIKLPSDYGHIAIMDDGDNNGEIVAYFDDSEGKTKKVPIKGDTFEDIVKQYISTVKKYNNNPEKENPFRTRMF